MVKLVIVFQRLLMKLLYKIVRGVSLRILRILYTSVVAIFFKVEAVELPEELVEPKKSDN